MSSTPLSLQSIICRIPSYSSTLFPSLFFPMRKLTVNSLSPISPSSIPIPKAYRSFSSFSFSSVHKNDDPSPSLPYSTISHFSFSHSSSFSSSPKSLSLSLSSISPSRSYSPFFSQSPCKHLNPSNIIPSLSFSTDAKDSSPSASSSTPLVPTVPVTFILTDGTRKTVSSPIGSTLLEIAHSNDVELEGACEGSLACSTCHLIVSPSFYPLMPEPSDEENDMLDMAYGLTETSRLGCQIKITESLKGLEVTIPQATRNMAVDGYKPKPH